MLNLLLTEKASDKVRGLMEQQEGSVMLRVYMTAAGGGFRYGLAFDDKADPEQDLQFEENGIKIVVDRESAAYLDGTEIDYVETFDGGGFTINNPNIKVTNGEGCACGGGGCGCGCGA